MKYLYYFVKWVYYKYYNFEIRLNYITNYNAYIFISEKYSLLLVLSGLPEIEE